MSETVIARLPPRDGREWDNQCARCGSSMMWRDCDNCGGEGVSGHECGEDTCCCADPDEENVTCDWCMGHGGHYECCSTTEWCQTHPREGREGIAAGTPEWFVVREAARGTGGR